MVKCCWKIFYIHKIFSLLRYYGPRASSGPGPFVCSRCLIYHLQSTVHLHSLLLCSLISVHLFFLPVSYFPKWLHYTHISNLHKAEPIWERIINHHEQKTGWLQNINIKINQSVLDADVWPTKPSGGQSGVENHQVMKIVELPLLKNWLKNNFNHPQGQICGTHSSD